MSEDETRPLVSLLINSYNYERYVGAAIASALQQSHGRVEVIVVDDGSTDGSWSVIQSFGAQIRALRTDNRGQASAYNEGMALARGRFVLFLDSDDLLHREAIACAVAAMADPAVAKVQFRLRLIDGKGAPLPGAVPYLMHRGDLRALVRSFGLYAGPPGSGNLYRRSAIEHCFPLALAPWRRGGADTVPFVACVFQGRVVSLDRVLGAYRLHRRREGMAGLFGNTDATYRDALQREAQVAQRIRALIAQDDPPDGVARSPEPLLPTPSQLRIRCLSWKLERAEHPHPEDSLRMLMRLVRRVLAHWPGYGAGERAILQGWLLAVLLLPRPLSAQLARTGTFEGAKAILKRWRVRPT